MDQFPLIQVRGDPRTCGRQHGSQTAELIRRNLTGYWQLFAYYAQLDRTAVLARAPEFLAPIQAYAPDLAEELVGIAEGADLPLLEIVALNCRTEFLAMGTIPPVSECSAVFAAPEATASGHALLAQNWDWQEILRGGLVLLRVEQPGRPTVLTLTEAGMVGKIGLNAAGVGIGTNFLMHNRRRIGVPFHALLRQALNAPRLGRAVAAVYDAVRADSGNYLLADAAGEAIDLEATPTDVGFLYPQNGLLVHTNHFLTPRLQPGDHGILESDNTLLRQGRMERLLRPQIGRITIDRLKEALRDHHNRPRAICRHPDPAEPAVEQSATLASLIMDLTEGEIHLAVGEPCQADYCSIRL